MMRFQAAVLNYQAHTRLEKVLSTISCIVSQSALTPLFLYDNWNIIAF